MRIGVLASTLMLAAGEAGACTCSGSTFEQALRGNDLVFEGTVESISEAKSDLPTLPPEAASGTFRTAPALKSATFRVTREIKGVGSTSRRVDYVKGDGANCGADFTVGKTYRVFAHRGAGGKFSTSGCASNELLGEENWGVAVPEDDNDALDNICRTSDSSEQLRKFFLVQDRQRRLFDTYALERYLAPFERSREAKDSQTLIAAGRKAEEWRDFERMVAVFKRLTELRPEDARGWTGLGRALLSIGDHEGGLNALEKAAALDPLSEETREGLRKARLVARGAGTAGETDYRGLSADEIAAPGLIAPGIDLSGLDLRRGNFAGADLTGAGFRAASITYGNFNGAKLAGSRFEGAGLYDVAAGGFRGDFSDAILEKATLSESVMRYSKFERANLSDAKATNADLLGASFATASLLGADFTDATLEDANFQGARLQRAIFDGASLSDANFRGADLTGAKLEGAESTSGAKIDCATRLPFGLSVRRAQLIPVDPVCGSVAQNRDFSDQKWFYTDFSQLSLAQGDFRKAKLEGANFGGTNLSGADFSGTEVLGGSFQGADLTRARFIGAKISGEFAGGVFMDRSAAPPATLAETDFTTAEVVSGAFLGYDGEGSFAFTIDIASAKFDRTKLKCAAADHRDEIEDYEEALKEDPEEFSKDRIDGWLRIMKRRRDEAVSYLAAEEKLVRYIKGRWPNSVLDEQCQSYFAAAAPAR